MKRVVAALILDAEKLLVCQRTRHQTMPLKWEFPGGKIEDGEQPRDALRRELEEELGIQAEVGDEVSRIVHEYPTADPSNYASLASASIRANSRTESFVMFVGLPAPNCHPSTFWKQTWDWCANWLQARSFSDKSHLH